MKTKTIGLTALSLVLAVGVLGGILFQTGTLEELQGRFSTRVLTRAQIIKLIVEDTGVTVVSSTTKCTFTDIVGDEWYAESFYTACENGWISYPSATAADPNGILSTAQTSKIAYLAYGVTESLPSSASYTDVASDSWYYSYVESLNAVGAYSATSGTFGPDKSTTMTFVRYLTAHL